MAKGCKQFNPFIGMEVNRSKLDVEMGRTRPSADAAAGAPLSETEPDLFPCLVIICSSAFAFLKVRIRLLSIVTYIFASLSS